MHDTTRRELSAQEIIQAGRAQATRGAWERARDFTWALYSPAAAHVTYSQTMFPRDDHRLRTIQVLAFDAAGHLVPYDFAAAWWAGRDLPDEVLASAWECTQDDLARGLGDSLPDALRDELRAFAEECLGVETLHTWLGWNESETLTWMFDLSAPPLQPCAAIADDAGVSLTDAEIVAAGLERERLSHWTGAREYVHTLYGGRAVKAEVTAFSRYNDTAYDRDIRLDVFDAGGQRLFFDLRLPWWARFGFSEQEIARYAKEHDPAQAVPDPEYDLAYGTDANNRADGAIQRLATLLLGADFIETRGAWDSDTASYDLTQPPPLRYPRLWARDGDGG